MHKRKVVFLMPHLGGGGAERLAISLFENANAWEVHLILNRFEGPYALPEYLNSGRIHILKSNSSIGRLLETRRIVHNLGAEVALGILHPGNRRALGLKLLRSSAKSIVSIHNNQQYKMRKWLNRLEVRFYAIADGIITVSKGLMDQLVTVSPALASKCRVVYNGMDLYRIRESLKDVQPERPRPVLNHPFHLVAAGRLHPQKAFDVLIEAAHRVLVTGRQLRVSIYGEGSLRQDLQAKIDQLKWADVIQLKGFEKNIYPKMAEADLFVLSSRYEGFGNVIIEAQTAGVPVLSTRCPFGPEEIITDGYNGWLVPVDDPEQMAAKIMDIMDDPAARKRISDQATVNLNKWSVETMVSNYEKLFDELV